MTFTPKEHRRDVQENHLWKATLARNLKFYFSTEKELFPGMMHLMCEQVMDSWTGGGGMCGGGTYVRPKRRDGRMRRRVKKERKQSERGSDV